MLRRLGDELEQAAEAEQHDAQFAADEAERRKQEDDERRHVESIAYSLRMIDQHLGQICHDLRMGQLRVTVSK